MLPGVATLTGGGKPYPILLPYVLRTWSASRCLLSWIAQSWSDLVGSPRWPTSLASRGDQTPTTGASRSRSQGGRRYTL